MRAANVFTIPPGAPFLPTFAQALFEGRVVAGYSAALSPLDLAEATIYVPTRRAARALVDACSRALGRPSTLLPRILPLGGLEATETSLLFDEADAARAFVLPQAVGEIERRLHLARLVLAWGRALGHAIVGVDASGRRHDTSEPALVATAPLDAWHLAGELSSLIDELIIEDVAWSKLDPLVLPEFDQYWRITIDFLDVAVTEWPKMLAARGLVDHARRQVDLVDAQSRRIAEGGAPVIAIGSTGTNRATARLLAAIARAPHGAVVLPGLDPHLDRESWACIAGDGEREPSFTHPQAALARLLPILGIDRPAVVPLAGSDPDLALRERFVSEALRPAETTDRWRHFGEGLPLHVTAALARISLIEAADEREEALAVAIVLREVLETPGRTGALITPDRGLAQRVAAELLRFGIEIEDSAGRPLAATPAGDIARRILACAAEAGTAADLAALLAHPLTLLGHDRAVVARLAPLFEIGVLRASAKAGALAEDSVSRAKEAARGQGAHAAQKRIGDADWGQLADLAARLRTALAPLMQLAGEQTLGTWVAAHREAMTRVVIGPHGAPAAGEDRERIEALLDEVAAYASDDMLFDARTYLRFFAALAGEERLPALQGAHPRLKILGLLEARLMSADLVVLGGLDEVVWPPQARGDVFLNRPMRAALGLTPAERRIGQTAHDFVQAMGARDVVISRAAKRDGAPTVASRFVQRLAALAGEAWHACRARGAVYRDWARALDKPDAPSFPLKRPSPKPPLDLRPTRLSVTRIETLRRDPYAVYAESCLRLVPLPPWTSGIDRREIGTAVHDVLARFTQAFAEGALPADAPQRFEAMLAEALGSPRDDPDFRALEWPRLRRAAGFYLALEADRRNALRRIEVETRGELPIVLQDGTAFTLAAVADRIEHHHDGSVSLLDFKTGRPPGLNEVFVGFAPQLTLEAAMAARGAFGLAPGTLVAAALYVKFGGAAGGEIRALEFSRQEETLEGVAEKHFTELLALLGQFRLESTGYPSRPYPKFVRYESAYDHLARVKEWALSGEEAEA